MKGKKLELVLNYFNIFVIVFVYNEDTQGA